MPKVVTDIRVHTDADPNDEALVLRAREGAAWAKRTLFERHAPRIIGLLTRLLSSSADAEDAAQEVFFLAFRDLGQLREPGGFGGWVSGIAVHQAHRSFRKRKFLRLFGLSHSELDATLERVADPNASPEQRAELSQLQSVLDGLPANDRTAWMLRRVEGYELADAAQLVGCSLATVKRRIGAADAAIDKVFGRETADETGGRHE